VPAHVATEGVQFAFYGTGATGQQYMQADHTFADVSTLTSPDLPLVTVVAGATQVKSVTIANGGQQYTTAPKVTFSNPPAGGVTATGTAVLSNIGAVTEVIITNAGYGYTSAPTVTFMGGGGSGGATGTAQLGQVYTTTQLVSIPVPAVQNTSSPLPFFVGAVDSNVLVINNGLVATPTSSSVGDAVYGFLEVNYDAAGALDVDVTTVDQFGLPFRVEFLKDDKTPITTNYPYNQGVGTLAGLDRAKIFEDFKAQYPLPTDPWSASWAQGAYDAKGKIDPSGTPIRLVPTRSLLTDPTYADQLGGLTTYYDGVLDKFFDYYQDNDFVFSQSRQGGSKLNPGPNYGTVWSGRMVTVEGTYTPGTPVDPSNTFGIEALQLTGQTGITGVTVNDNGNGAGTYAQAPTVTIGLPDQHGGKQATATAIMSGVLNPNGTGLSIAGFRIDNPGSGYTTVPSVTFAGGGGTGASAKAVINEFPGCVVNIYNPLSIQANAKANKLPSWMTTGSIAWDKTLPSAMVAASAQAFASNAVDPGVNTPTSSTPNDAAGATPLGTALGEIENVIASAFTRGIATMPSKTAFSSDPSKPALLSPQQFVAGTSYNPISWAADPTGQNLSGGTLTPGAYWYAFTTVDAHGNETVPTRTVKVTLNSQQNAAQLYWSPIPPDQSQLVANFRVYRGTTPQTLKLVGQVANNVTPPATGFIDGDPKNPPPPSANAALPYQFYAAGQTYDAFSKFLHDTFINGLGYGFAYDDQGNFSSNVGFTASTNPSFTRIVINDLGKAERFDIGGPSTAVAGTMFQATVTAEQGDMLSFSSTDPQAVLPPGGAFDPSATFPITLKTAGVQMVTVSDAKGAKAAFSVTVSPGQAAKLGFVGQPTFAYANRFFKTPVSVQVQDTYGNSVAHGGDQVSLKFISPNGATLLGQTKANTAANGLATFPLTGPTGLRVSRPGNYAFKATYTGTALNLASATSQTFSISTPAKTKVFAPTKVTVNSSFVITVRGPDQFFQDTVTFAVSPALNAWVRDADGRLRPFNGFKYTFTAADLGVKKFTVSLGAPVTKRTLTANLLVAPDLRGSTFVQVTKP